MVGAITAGLVLGLSAGFAPGPLLTLVITQTLRHGVGEGIKVALAPLVTDLPIIILSLLVLTQVSRFQPVLGVISLIGGFYVLYLAYENFKAGPVSLERSGTEPNSIRRGALINALNPHPYLFWVTVGSPLLLKLKTDHPAAPFLFAGVFYVLLVGSKIFLAILVGQSGGLLSSKGYLYVLRVLGGLLALFAFVLIKDGLRFLGVLPL